MRVILTYSLVFSLVFGPTIPTAFAQVSNNNQSDFSSQAPSSREFGYRIIDEPLKSSELASAPLLKDAVFGARDWSKNNERNLGPILDLAEKLEAFKTKLILERGEESVKKMITRGDLIFKEVGLGTAEYKELTADVSDGVGGTKKEVVLCPRILLAKSDRAYLLLDSSKVSPESNELRKLVAKTNILSGANRPVLNQMGEPETGIFGPKTTTGRDLTLVWMEHNDLSSTQDIHTVAELPRPTTASFKWWKRYFYSKYERPTLNEFTMAWGTGVAMQGGLATLISYVSSQVFGTEMNWAITAWAGAYSLSLGTMYSTYRQWVIDSGSKLTRVLKGQAVSSPFAGGIVFISTQGTLIEKLAKINFMTADGFLNWGKILQTGLSDNFAKDYWFRTVAFRTKYRLNDGTVNVSRLFGKEWEATRWQKSNIESQIWYLAPWTVKTSIQLAIGYMGAVSWWVPFLPLLAVPLTMKITKDYSRKVAERFAADPALAARAEEVKRDADEFEKQWRDSWGMDVRQIPLRLKDFALYLQGVYERGQAAIRARTKPALSTCRQLFAID